MTELINTIKAAKEIVNIGFRNSKMPGTVFSQDAFACNVGSRLAEIEGSTCNKCYARRIQHMRPNVAKSWKQNLEMNRKAMETGEESFTDAAVFIINKKSNGFHRWFDSGDIDSLDQLKWIVKVAIKTPDVKHWLPTREIAIVKDYLKTNTFPKNLVVRISSPMIDDKPLKGWTHTSTVHTKGNEYAGVECEAYKRDNSCGDCRACWNPKVKNISYKKH